MPAFPSGLVASTPGSYQVTRRLGTVVLDSDVSLITRAGIPIQTSPDHQVERVSGRFGRMVESRFDWKPLDIEIRGMFLDDPTTGRYYADFKAAITAQRRVNYDLGNGREYRWVDVIDMMETRSAGVLGYGEVWAWTLKLASYEPFMRTQTVSLQALGASGVYNISYTGTAFAEPSWVFPCSGGEAYSISNAQSGETISGNVPNSPGGAGQCLIDATGAKQNTSPDNMAYGLLPIVATFGYGVTYYNGTGYYDGDFTGTPPTLIPNPSPTLPPTPYTNVITWSGPGTLSMLAPARYLR